MKSLMRLVTTGAPVELLEFEEVDVLGRIKGQLWSGARSNVFSTYTYLLGCTVGCSIPLLEYPKISN